MMCPSIARIAAAASGEDPAVVAHAATCTACTTALAKERTTRVVVADLPDVQLPARRRAAMRAELLAASDAAPAVAARRGSRSVGVIIAAALAAAAVAIVLARRDATPRAASAPVAVASGSAPAGFALREPASAPTAVASAGSAALSSAATGQVPDSGPPARVASPSDPRAPAEAVAASDAKGFERTGDVVRVADGAVVLDARGRQPARLVVGAARVAVADSQVQVTVRHGQLVQVQVFAGTVEVTVPGRVQIVTVGDVWEPPPPPQPPRISRAPRVPQMPDVPQATSRIATAPTWVPTVPPASAPRTATALTWAPATAPAPALRTATDPAWAPVPAPAPRTATGPAWAPVTAPAPAPGIARASSDAPPAAGIATAPTWAPDAPTRLPRPTPTLDAFRIGWQALRAGHYADAIHAFDRATAPAVAEDASYWAAVAAARSGDQPAAQRRLRAFLQAYPTSPHAAEARAALRP